MPLPADLAVRTVTGRHILGNGAAPTAGSVTFRAPYALVSVGTDTVVLPSTYSADIDTDTGEWSLTLPTTDDPQITPTGWAYVVTVTAPGYRQTFRTLLPAGATIDFTDLAPVVTPDPLVDYVDSVELAAVLAGYLATGQAVLLNPAARNDATGSATDTWLRVALPNSPADDSVDAFAFMYDNGLGGSHKTGYFNGNGEVRGAPSRWNRVAARFFEWAEANGEAHVGNTGNILEVSTNPAIVANREALLSVRGTEHATEPGYVVATRAVKAPNLTPGAWVAPTLEAGAGSAIAESGMTFQDVASRLESTESGVVRFRGTLGISGAGFASGATMFTVPLAHRPSFTRNQIIRTTAPGGGTSVQTRLSVNTDGTVELNSAIVAGTNVHLDSFTYALT